MSTSHHQQPFLALRCLFYLTTLFFSSFQAPSSSSFPFCPHSCPFFWRIPFWAATNTTPSYCSSVFVSEFSFPGSFYVGIPTTPRSLLTTLAHKRSFPHSLTMTKSKTIPLKPTLPVSALTTTTTWQSNTDILGKPASSNKPVHFRGTTAEKQRLGHKNARHATSDDDMSIEQRPRAKVKMRITSDASVSLFLSSSSVTSHLKVLAPDKPLDTDFLRLSPETKVSVTTSCFTFHPWQMLISMANGFPLAHVGYVTPTNLANDIISIPISSALTFDIWILLVSPTLPDFVWDVKG